MNTNATLVPDTKSKAVAHSQPKQSGSQPALTMEDNRSTAIVQQKMQQALQLKVQAGTIFKGASKVPSSGDTVQLVRGRIRQEQGDDEIYVYSQAIDESFGIRPQDSQMPTPPVGSVVNFDISADRNYALNIVPLTQRKFQPSFLDHVGGGRAATRRTATPNLDGTWALSDGVVSGNPQLGKAYSFVTLEDGTVRVWPIIGAQDTFHKGLAAFAEYVRYAGEIKFNDQNQVAAWNNKSGNFKPVQANAAAAGLPMDKFNAHEDGAPHLTHDA